MADQSTLDAWGDDADDGDTADSASGGRRTGTRAEDGSDVSAGEGKSESPSESEGESESRGEGESRSEGEGEGESESGGKVSVPTLGRPLDDGLPDDCLSLTVSGSWAHFRRIDANIMKPTYRVMPRTTVAGLLAAIVGVGRDEYYDIFAADRSRIAVEPIGTLRTVSIPVSSLSTVPEAMESTGSGTLGVELPDASVHRRRMNYEVLVDPAYRLDVLIADDEFRDRLRRRLESGTSCYTPTLGLSEYIARIDYHGSFPVAPGPRSGRVDVDSTVPDSAAVVPSGDTSHKMERSPAIMSKTEAASELSGRRRIASVTHAFHPRGDRIPARAVDLAVTEIDGRTVAFS